MGLRHDDQPGSDLGRLPLIFSRSAPFGCFRTGLLRVSRDGVSPAVGGAATIGPRGRDDRAAGASAQGCFGARATCSPGVGAHRRDRRGTDRHSQRRGDPVPARAGRRRDGVVAPAGLARRGRIPARRLRARRAVGDGAVRRVEFPGRNRRCRCLHRAASVGRHGEVRLRREGGRRYRRTPRPRGRGLALDPGVDGPARRRAGPILRADDRDHSAGIHGHHNRSR